MKFAPDQVRRFAEDYARASGQRLASIRGARTMTQAQLAEFAEVTQQLVSYAEAGIRLPSFTVQMKLCSALQCKHSDIWPTPDRELFQRRTIEVAA